MSGISINHEAKTVRLYANGEQHYFSWKQHGGLDNALAAALKEESRLSPSIRFQCRFHTNGWGASGIAGVGKKMLRGEQVGWIAYYQAGPEGGRRQVRKSFTFSQYGRHAQACAVQWREVMVKEAFGS